jgi:hypothetical protein
MAKRGSEPQHSPSHAALIAAHGRAATPNAAAFDQLSAVSGTKS